MFEHFLSLQWKAFFRSSSLGKSIGLKILMGFLAIYFIIIFLLLGIGLYPLITDRFPEMKPVEAVNRFVLIWLGMELLLRFMLQNLPVMSVKPLMVTPVPKRKMINFVLIRSLLSFYNFLPLFVIVPFSLFVLYKTNISIVGMLAWMTSVYFLSLSVNYLNFLLKKKFAENIRALAPFLVVVGTLALLESLDVLRITEIFGTALDLLVPHPYLVVIPILLFLTFFKLNQIILKRRLYLDDSLRGKVEQADERDFEWVRKFGDIAPFLQLDLKLIWRNKRPKTTIFLSLIIIGYGLIFYPEDTYQNLPAVLVFVGVFMTGIFMINFGQFIPAWDAGHYSMMMSQNIPLKKYLASKAGLITFSVIVLTVLTTPYVYFGWKILVINLACAIYNIGVNVPVLLYTGSFNRKRIELDKSPFMNYQGVGAAQWLVGIPLMVVPVLLFWMVNKFLSFEGGVGVLFALGLIGIVFREPIMTRVEEAYRKSKYAMIQGFRETGQ